MPHAGEPSDAAGPRAAAATPVAPPAFFLPSPQGRPGDFITRPFMHR